MNEIIDFTEQKPNDLIYLNRSARLYKINGGLIIFSIAISVFLKPLVYKGDGKYADLFDILVGLPVLIAFVLAPLGLFYSWKSYRRKEGDSRRRFRFTIGHLFFCLLMVIILIV